MNLDQMHVHESFLQSSKGHWTTVCESWREPGVASQAVYAAFAPAEKRVEVLSDSSWSLTKGDYRPQFSFKDDQSIAEYQRFGGSRGYEPLVLLRSYHGVVPNALEIVEDFRLFHNLYWDELAQKFMKPNDDGSSSAAAKISGGRVEVYTRLLRQYQAARQLDLVLFIDSFCFSAEEIPESYEWRTDLLSANRYSGLGSSGSTVNCTRYLATQVVPPPLVEKSGIWPYEEKDDHFPDFIIGTNEDGDEIRHTCNSAALDSNFGANSDSPSYLTPVHFRREVLQKYYEKQELYTVSDGYLSCAGLWGIEIDNSANESVAVFLGDLGNKLPKQERDY